MKDFSVCNKIFGESIGFLSEGDVCIGMAPGKFDTKQLLLCTLAVLSYKDEKHVSFVRTLNKEYLRKCRFFINDDFVTLIPMIPSYYDIQFMWEKKYTKILEKFYIYSKEIADKVRDLIGEKLCDLYDMDCLMQLFDPHNPDESFENALKMSIIITSEVIKKAISDVTIMPTIDACIENMVDNHIYIPLYVENWREAILRNKDSYAVDYVVMRDIEGSYIISSMNKDFLIRKYIKGVPNVSYSGRFYAKVSDIKTAEKIVSKLPKSQSYLKQKHA